MKYTARQIDYFKDQLINYSNHIILKAELIEFALSHGLDVRKNTAKDKVISLILDNDVLTEKLLDLYSSRIHIPYYIVATQYCLTYYQVEELDHLGIIKSLDFKSEKGATLYPFSILAYDENYLINEYEKIFKTDFHRTRIEFKNNDEDHVSDFIDKLSNVFDIENMSKLYKKRDDEGYHLYLSIRPKTKALNNDSILASQNANLKTNLSIEKAKVAELENRLKALEKDIYTAPQYVELRNEFNELKTKSKTMRIYEVKYKSLEEDYEKLKADYDVLSSSINSKSSGRPNKLSDSDKELIKMYRMQKKSYREIASLFNCSIGLVSKVLKGFNTSSN